jgi:hypothetical protein
MNFMSAIFHNSKGLGFNPIATTESNPNEQCALTEIYIINTPRKKKRIPHLVPWREGSAKLPPKFLENKLEISRTRIGPRPDWISRPLRDNPVEGRGTKEEDFEEPRFEGRAGGGGGR